MSGLLSPDDALNRALVTLEPDGSLFVIIGGWALRLLATRPEAMPLGREVLVTTDLDVAIRTSNLPPDVRVGERLADAGFEARMSGDAKPPATDYVIDTTSGEFSVEFVGQRPGGPVLRGGRVNATRSELGIVVQLLPHLQPALAATWSVARSVPSPDGRGEVTLQFDVPNPASYIVQKLLSMKDRPSVKKQERDLLYIIDAIYLFGDALSDIAAASRAEIRCTLSSRSRSKLRERIAELSVVRDLHRGAAIQARDAGLADLDDPRVLAFACRAGLERLGEF